MNRSWNLIIALSMVAAFAPGTLASGLEPKSLFFKPGMPRDGSTLTESLSEPAHGLAGLQTNLALLRAMDLAAAGYLFQVTGDADSNECSGTECEALSLRRAQLVHRWLVNHGADPAVLIQPKGYGTSRPVAGPEDPQNNRRAQFDMLAPGDQ